jgi:NitT/TauT family transport system substrate-binding protein
MKTKHIRVVANCLILGCALVTATPAPGQTKRVHVAFSSIAVVQSAVWITKEAGLFDKYELPADIIYVASGTTVSQAMIAGEFPFGLVGGAIVNANLSGADFAIIGGVVNRPNFYLTAHPTIKKPADLKGKAIGITRYGSSTDFVIRYLVRRWGMDPDRDVKILQTGGQPEILASMKAGVVQAGVTGSPTDYLARMAGFVVLEDMGKIGLDYPVNSLVTTRSFTRKDPAAVKKFLMASFGRSSDRFRFLHIHKTDAGRYQVQDPDRYRGGSETELAMERGQIHASAGRRTLRRGLPMS